MSSNLSREELIKEFKRRQQLNNKIEISRWVSIALVLFVAIAMAIGQKFGAGADWAMCPEFLLLMVFIGSYIASMLIWRCPACNVSWLGLGNYLGNFDSSAKCCRKCGTRFVEEVYTAAIWPSREGNEVGNTNDQIRFVVMIAMGGILLFLFVILPFFGANIGINFGEFVCLFFFVGPLAFLFAKYFAEILGGLLKRFLKSRPTSDNLNEIFALAVATLVIIVVLRSEAGMKQIDSIVRWAASR